MDRRKRRLPGRLAAWCLLACLAQPARAAHFTVVTTDSNTFDPPSLTIAAGDTVTFENVAQGIHNVHADDGSFRCANGCDGQGGDGSLSSSDWSFQLTFNQPATVGYYCDNHGFPGGGMHGTITVMPATIDHGSLGFSSGGYGVPENGGSATITVLRAGGSSGAVSVHYATVDGTGVAGTHYRSTSGTLAWGDGDGSPQSFTVAVLDDGVVDGSHTVKLFLRDPIGGAALGGAMAVLTITDADQPASVPPAAPKSLTATPVDTTDVLLQWKPGSSNEADFRVQSKPLDGSSFQDVLPLAPAGATSLTVSGLKPATGYGFRVRAENGSGNSAYTAEIDAATDAAPGPCAADANTLCLGAGGRFKTTVAWATVDGKSGAGAAIALPSNPDSGLFYFFGANNIEMLIKVLAACVQPFNSYWVFFAATTNVQVTVTVVDTKSGRTRVYFNPLNQAAQPVQDTSAFVTCP